MNKEDLVIAINKCIAEGCGIEIFVGLKNSKLRKVNFLENTQEEIKRLFIQEIQSKIIESDSDIVDFSRADERNNAIYRYDLEMTEDMSVFDSVNDAQNGIQIFSFKNDGINNISYFLIIIGGVKHSIVIYKQLAAVNIYRKNSGLFVWESDNGCARIEKDFLRIVPGVDIFKINKELYIMDLAIVERIFNLYDVIKASAKKQINIIKGSGLVENIDDISTELSNISFARKLSKISEYSPVLGKIENKKIIEFAKAHPALKDVIRYSANGTQIKLTSKKSKYLFLKLLNDDYLTSNLTSIYYDSLAKDPIKP